MDALLIVGCLIIAVGGAILLVSSLVMPRRTRSRPRCPGATSGKRAIWRFGGRRCHYDLSGLSAIADSVTCPECGCRTALARAMRLPVRRRCAAAGGALLALGPSGAAALMLSTDGWQQGAPTAVLLLHLDVAESEATWREVRSRIGAGSLNESHERRVAPLLWQRLIQQPQDYGLLIDIASLGRRASALLPDLVSYAESDPPGERYLIPAMGAVGDERAAHLLAAADTRHRYAAERAVALGVIGDEAGVPFCLQLIEDVSDETWTAYSRRLDSRAAWEYYVQTVSDHQVDDKLRAAINALLAVGRIRHPDYRLIEVTRRIANDLDPARTNFAAQAALAVLEERAPALSDALVVLMQPPNHPFVRREAASSLAICRYELNDQLATELAIVCASLETYWPDIDPFSELAECGAEGQTLLRAIAKVKIATPTE